MNFLAIIFQFLFLNNNYNASLPKIVIFTIFISLFIFYLTFFKGKNNHEIKSNLKNVFAWGIFLLTPIAVFFVMFNISYFSLVGCRHLNSLSLDKNIKLVKLVKTSNFVVDPSITQSDNLIYKVTYRNKKHHPIAINADANHVFFQTKVSSIKHKHSQVEIYKVKNVRYKNKAQKIFKGTSVPTNNELTKYGLKPLKKKNNKFVTNDEFKTFSFSPKQKYAIILTSYDYLK